MGAWGWRAFENDTACDWAYELEKSSGTEFLRSTLNAAMEPQGDLDASAGCEAVAACEVLARLLGRGAPSDAYTESVDLWIEAHPQSVPPDLVALALAALDRVGAEGSELAELWEGDADWSAGMSDLRARLSG